VVSLVAAWSSSGSDDQASVMMFSHESFFGV
jgi:hypothetical protein